MHFLPADALILLAVLGGIETASISEMLMYTKLISQCSEKFKPLTDERPGGVGHIEFNCQVSGMLVHDKDMTYSGVGRVLEEFRPGSAAMKVNLVLMKEALKDDVVQNSEPSGTTPEQPVSSAEAGKPTDSEECRKLRSVNDDRWPKPKVGGQGVVAAISAWLKDARGAVMHAVADCLGKTVGSAKPTGNEDRFVQGAARKSWGVKKGHKTGSTDKRKIVVLEALAFFNCALVRTAHRMKTAKFTDLLEYGFMERLYNYSTADLDEDFEWGKSANDMAYPWMKEKSDVCLQNKAAIYGMMRFHEFVDTHIRNVSL